MVCGRSTAASSRRASGRPGLIGCSLNMPFASPNQNLSGIRLFRICHPYPRIRDYYDITSRETDDLLSPGGFLLAIRQTLRLKPGALLWGGVPCSSWVFMSSSVSGRRKMCPDGDTSQPCVQQGTQLMTRFMLLALLAACRGVYWCIEQPGSSVMVHHRRIRRFEKITQLLLKTRLSLGLYGHLCQKPTQLFGTAWGAQTSLSVRAVWPAMHRS